MLRITICALLTVGVLSMPSKLNPLRDSEWELFKLTYSKEYNPSEEIIRRVTWENNLDTIEKHNAEYKEGMHTYTLGVNAYADLSLEEFVSQMNGYQLRPERPAKDTFRPPSHLDALPTTVDWRKKGYVTRVKNQGGCGSCWAFSATGSLEGQHFKKTGDLVSLSEQNLVDCSWKEGNKGCRGGLMDKAFQYVVDNHGIDTERSYPYTGKDGRCKFNNKTIGATCAGYVDIRSGSEKALQMAVATVGPISVAIDANHTSFFLYKSGVFNLPACSSTHLDHGVLAVGYGLHDNLDYWLVKNSWGKSWGMQGYVMMSRNKDNQCGIATAASYPKV